jgi:hypothetical protein
MINLFIFDIKTIINSVIIYVIPMSQFFEGKPTDMFNWFRPIVFGFTGDYSWNVTAFVTYINASFLPVLSNLTSEIFEHTTRSVTCVHNNYILKKCFDVKWSWIKKRTPRSL